MGLVDSIKNDVKKSGANRGKFIYFREGVKQRIRFLSDMDEGMEIPFHDSFEKKITVPCQQIFGRDCDYCSDDQLRTRNQYVWPVYNYDANEVQLFMFPVNNCSPLPALVAMYETYGTLTDRDYVISVSGKMQNKTYSVVPMDKVKFRNAKAKPLSEKTILKMLDKAWPADVVDDMDDDDDDEDERPSKKSKGGKKRPDTKSSKKKKPDYDDEDEDEDDDYDGEDEDDEEDDEIDYKSMTAKELFKLCKKREIDVPARKPEKYYIKQLQEYDKAQNDWDDDDEDWDEE